MQFVILGKPTRGKDELKKQILKLGGKVITKISKDVMAVFATKEDVEKMGSRMMDVKEQDVHVVPEEFVDEASKYNGRIPELIKEKTISDWGSDVIIHFIIKNNNVSLIYAFSYFSLIRDCHRNRLLANRNLEVTTRNRCQRKLQ